MIRAAIDIAVESAVAAGAPLVIAAVTGREGTRYLRAAGPDAEPAGNDTVIALHSVTKAFTTTSALQCVEDGLLDLDAPARRHVPELGTREVLEGFAGDGGIRTRPPSRDITARMLLQHTSGFGYDMFDDRYAALARRRPASATPLRDSLETPLLHDPGERWTYGTSMDWLGLVVEAVRGRRLDDVFRAGIFEPAGLSSTSFDVTPAMRSRLAPLRRRTRDGTIATSAAPPDHPEHDMGGQGLYSTAPDVLRLLRVWLGDGSAAHGRVLRSDTIEWAVRGVPGLSVAPLRAAIPAVTRDVDFLPGIATSWAHSFLVNDDDVPGGRRAGSLTWGGLANVHYWIDRSAGIAAVWAMQLLPFFDTVAMDGLAAFEAAVYAEE